MSPLFFSNLGVKFITKTVTCAISAPNLKGSINLGFPKEACGIINAYRSGGSLIPFTFSISGNTLSFSIPQDCEYAQQTVTVKGY